MNRQVVRMILEQLGHDPDDFDHVTDRVGHDLRYAIDSTKLRTELGWEPEITWDEGMRRTVEWYAERRSWWLPLLERAPVREDAWAGR